MKFNKFVIPKKANSSSLDKFQNENNDFNANSKLVIAAAGIELQVGGGLNSI